MTDQIEQIYEQFLALVTQDKADEAKEYIIANLEHLPQDLQDEITAKLFMQAVIDEAQEIETIDKLREESLQAGEALLAIKGLLEKESHSEE